MGFVYVQGSLVSGHRWVFSSPKQPVTLKPGVKCRLSGLGVLWVE